MRCHDCDCLMRVRRNRNFSVGREHKGRNLCARCYYRRYDNGTLIDVPRKTRAAADLVQDFTELAEQGYCRADIADRIGMRLASMDRQLMRARNAGMDIPVVPRRALVS